MIITTSQGIVAMDSVVGDPTSLIQFGVLGVILMLVLFGFLWAKPSVDRLIADKEKAEQQRDALMETFQQQVIPFLSDVKERVVPGINKILENQASVSSRLLESDNRREADLKALAKAVDDGFRGIQDALRTRGS